MIAHFYSEASLLSFYYFANYMNILKEKDDKSTRHSSKGIPVVSEYAKSLKSRVNERYSQKISVIGVDPASIPAEQFSPECLPPVEVPNLLSYLVLETSSTSSSRRSRVWRRLIKWCRICNLSCRQSNRRQVCRESSCSAFTANE